MAGRTGIAKKGKLYGDWGMSDMEDQLGKGVDEAQAAGAAALAEKPKYRGRKSDLAWLKKHGKARVSGKKKKSEYDPDRDKTKKQSRKGGNIDTTGYKVVQGDSPEMESYAPPKKKKAKKKRVGRTLY